MAPEITFFTYMLTNTREELMEETPKTATKRRCRCYTANMHIGGILTKTLIDTGAEVKCISEEFLNINRERFDHYPSLRIAGVTVAGSMGGKAVKLAS